MTSKQHQQYIFPFLSLKLRTLLEFLRNVLKFKIKLQDWHFYQLKSDKKVCTSVVCIELNHLSLVVMAATRSYCLRWPDCFLLVKPGTGAKFEKADSFLQFLLKYNITYNETIDHVINTTPLRNFIQYLSIYNIYTMICLKSLDIDDQWYIAIYIAHLWCV